MIKAIREVGIRKSFKFFLATWAKLIFNLLIFSPLRVLFLVLWGSKIGKDTIINQINFFNLYRTGFGGLEIGRGCFLADGVFLDLADKIIIEDQVTLAVRAMVLTHTNVGYCHHPLQKYFPSFQKPVRLKKGCFIGAGAIILPGITVGESSFVAAGAVVTKDVPAFSLVAGVPAKKIKKIK